MRLENSLVGYDCFIHARAELVDSILLAGCDIGAGALVNRVMLDKNVRIAADARVGLDPELDRQRFPWITPNGWITLPKGTFVPAEGPIELARDMHDVLRNDETAAAELAAVAAGYTVSDRGRHSYESAGPRYRRLADHGEG